MNKKVFLIIFALFLSLPSLAMARIGVGVGTGKIQVDEQLKPGTIYNLPALTVLNTGDEPTEYEVSIAYHEKQPELQPQESWFMFSPQKFHLEPGEVQTVEIKLNLPFRIEPGNYFAYLEGHPAKKVESGETSVGIAAAAKLYFTVAPGSFFEGVYFKLLSFWKVYHPWPQRASMVLGALIAWFIFKKFFNIQINVRKTDTKPKHPSE